ncbi:MAG: preprotein translocase subunit SecE [Ktedonobacterales bacterium]
MAKTINRETNSDAGAEAQDAEETELVNEAEPDDALDDDEGDLDDEAPTADERRAVAPVDDERIVARTGGTGVYVPDGLLKSPFTRTLAEAYIELRKVTWPTREDAWNMSIVVISVSAIMAGLLAASDWGLGHALTYLVNLGLGK